MLTTFTAQVTEKKEVAPHIFWFKFRLQRPPMIEFAAGQYVVVRFPQTERSVVRLYSICSPADQKHEIELLLQAVPNGVASTYFRHLETGADFSFQAPAGRFLVKDNPRDKIFLATGTGIAPIRSQIITILRQQSYTPVKGTFPHLTLWWGLRMSREVYFVDQWLRLEKEHPHFSFTICLSQEPELNGLDQAHFRKGRITDQTEMKTLSPQSEYYLCGGPVVVAAISEFLASRGADKTRIFFEKF